MEVMKVLNVAQPNAHKIAWKGKNVENRTKTVSFRGTIFIYASKTKKPHFFEDQDVKPEDCAFGAIVAIADLVDCIGEDEVNASTEEWFSGPYGYVLENIQPLKEPIKVKPPKGAVIWWPLSGELLNQCLNQFPDRELLPLKKVNKRPNIFKYKANTNLSKVIGQEPLTIREAFNEFADYIESNDLTYNEEAGTIEADPLLKEVFGTSVIELRKFKELIQQNSEKVIG